MLGMVYIVLTDMIEEESGLAMLNSLIREVEIPYEGAVTTGDILDDGKLVELIQCYANKTGIPVDFILRRFGEYFLTKASYVHQDIMRNYHTAKEFINAVDGIIHREVVKLYPGAITPRFIIHDEPPVYIMEYYSERRLCHFAEGLISATGTYFNTEIALIHSKCVHRGDAFCRFELTFDD